MNCDNNSSHHLIFCFSYQADLTSPKLLIKIYCYLLQYINDIIKITIIILIITVFIKYQKQFIKFSHYKNADIYITGILLGIILCHVIIKYNIIYYSLQHIGDIIIIIIAIIIIIVYIKYQKEFVKLTHYIKIAIIKDGKIKRF